MATKQIAKSLNIAVAYRMKEKGRKEMTTFDLNVFLNQN